MFSDWKFVTQSSTTDFNKQYADQNIVYFIIIYNR